MTRRVLPLTGDRAALLPDPCDRCLLWELGSPPPDRHGPTPLPGWPPRPAPSEPGLRKQAWVSAVTQDVRPPGRLVTIDDEVAGFALYAPAQRFAARRPDIPAASTDSLLLATVRIVAPWRGRGLGRLLLHAALRDALRVGARGLEAYGDRRWQDRACLLPAGWLLHEGFEVRREHPRTPLLRVDLRRAARWAGSLEQAVEEVLGALPRRVPQHPVPRPVVDAGYGDPTARR